MTREVETFHQLIQDAIVEAQKAAARYPQPNYIITKIAEEAGEVVKEAVHCAEGRGSVDDLRKEMRQLIAMLFRLWVEGDGYLHLKPVWHFKGCAYTERPAASEETPGEEGVI